MSGSLREVLKLDWGITQSKTPIKMNGIIFLFTKSHKNNMLKILNQFC